MNDKKRENGCADLYYYRLSRMMTGTSFDQLIIQQVKSKEVRAVGYTTGAGLVKKFLVGSKQDQRETPSFLSLKRWFAVIFQCFNHASHRDPSERSHRQRESMFFLREESDLRCAFFRRTSGNFCRFVECCGDVVRSWCYGQLNRWKGEKRMVLWSSPWANSSALRSFFFQREVMVGMVGMVQ